MDNITAWLPFLGAIVVASIPGFVALVKSRNETEITGVKIEIDALQKSVAELRKENRTLRDELQKLRFENATLRNENEALRDRVRDLETGARGRGFGQ